MQNRFTASERSSHKHCRPETIPREVISLLEPCGDARLWPPHAGQSQSGNITDMQVPARTLGKTNTCAFSFQLL